MLRHSSLLLLLTMFVAAVGCGQSAEEKYKDAVDSYERAGRG